MKLLLKSDNFFILGIKKKRNSIEENYTEFIN